MIPKVIHYCWFGRGEKGEDFKRYLEGWKKLLPDYEIKEWNEDNFDICCNDYCRESYRMRNFAFTSDVARMTALYNYGGIYLDTDVELVKSFDPFLDHKSFVGREGELIGTAVIGSEPGVPWVKKILDYYDSRHFIDRWGHPKRTPNTSILKRIIFPKLTVEETPAVYPHDFFCAKDVSAEQKGVMRTENTVAIHHFAATWRKKRTLKTRIRTILKGLKVRYLESRSKY